jgi:hypothetical protein
MSLADRFNGRIEFWKTIRQLWVVKGVARQLNEGICAQAGQPANKL